MRGISKGNNKMKGKKSEAANTIEQARIAFACSSLLGLTWVFGLLAVGKVTYVFQILFCIFNSLQGFYIFIMYTVRNTDVRKEWQNFVGLKKTKLNQGYNLNKILTSDTHRQRAVTMEGNI